MKILFGNGGSGGLGPLEGVRHCAELKLSCQEVAFTYGVRMTNAQAKEVGKEAKKLGIKLSVHAPYYINLASKEKAKITASKKRILQSCERAHHLGASPIVFHAGFYQGREEKEVFPIIKEAILDLQKTIKKNKWKVKLAPEVTGKKSAFAGLETLLKLKRATGCSICVDFAHLYARNNGKIDFDEVFKKLKPLSHVHCQFSGINFGPKGERNHILLKKAFFDKLSKAIKKAKPKSLRIINESPDIFGDAVKMKKWFSKK